MQNTGAQAHPGLKIVCWSPSCANLGDFSTRIFLPQIGDLTVLVILEFLLSCKFFLK